MPRPFANSMKRKRHLLGAYEAPDQAEWEYSCRAGSGGPFAEASRAAAGPGRLYKHLAQYG